MRKLIPIPKIKKMIWVYFSEWVRRTSKGICYCCGGHFDWKHEMDASHYHHNKLDYDPMNVKGCCKRCNHFLNGNLGAFAEHLVRDYGQDAVDDLRYRANQIWKPSREELEQLLVHWKDEVRILDLEGK